MPIFKGFEKENDTVLAVVDFPDAKKHSPYFQADGTIQNRVTPFPHEERLSEEAFKGKFLGLDFEAVKSLPFKEEGHDLKPLIAEKAREFASATPMPSHHSRPGNNSSM